MKSRLPVTPHNSISKIVAILLFLTFPLVVIYLITNALGGYKGGDALISLDSQPIPTYATEVTTINSEDSPELGLAGYSSGQLQIGGRMLQMRMLAPNRKKVILTSLRNSSSNSSRWGL